MKLSLESTGEIVMIQGARARVWLGATEKGTRVVAFISLLVVDSLSDSSELDAKLIEQLNVKEELPS